MSVKHLKTVPGATNGNPNQVQPEDWNEDHLLEGTLALLDEITPISDRVVSFGPDGSALLLPLSTWVAALNAALTGTPTAPTASNDTNTTQIATTAFVKNAVNALISAAPGALDTLDELAAALGDDANFAATITTALALKAPLASPVFTGNPEVPNQAALTNNARAANTAYVEAAIAALSALVVAGTTAVPGAVVGSSLTTYTANADLSTLVPADDTVPTNTEGTKIIETTYQPKNSTNKLRCTFTGQVSANGADNAIASIFQGSTNLGSQMVNINAANTKHTFSLVVEYTPGSQSLQTISVRVGGATINVRLNGGGVGRLLGGASAATLLIEEIKA